MKRPRKVHGRINAVDENGIKWKIELRHDGLFGRARYSRDWIWLPLARVLNLFKGQQVMFPEAKITPQKKVKKGVDDSPVMQ